MFPDTRHYEGVGNQLHYPLQINIATLRAWGQWPTKGERTWLMTEIHQDLEELYPDSVAQNLQGIVLTTTLKEAVHPLEAAW